MNLYARENGVKKHWFFVHCMTKKWSWNDVLLFWKFAIFQPNPFYIWRFYYKTFLNDVILKILHFYALLECSFFILNLEFGIDSHYMDGRIKESLRFRVLVLFLEYMFVIFIIRSFEPDYLFSIKCKNVSYENRFTTANSATVTLNSFLSEKGAKKLHATRVNIAFYFKRTWTFHCEI